MYLEDPETVTGAAASLVSDSITSLCHLRIQTLSAWIPDSSFHVLTATSITNPEVRRRHPVGGVHGATAFRDLVARSAVARSGIPIRARERSNGCSEPDGVHPLRDAHPKSGPREIRHRA